MAHYKWRVGPIRLMRAVSKIMFYPMKHLFLLSHLLLLSLLLNSCATVEKANPMIFSKGVWLGTVTNTSNGGDGAGRFDCRKIR